MQNYYIFFEHARNIHFFFAFICVCQKLFVPLHSESTIGAKEDGFDCLQPLKNNAKTCAARPNSRLRLFFYQIVNGK